MLLWFFNFLIHVKLSAILLMLKPDPDDRRNHGMSGRPHSWAEVRNQAVALSIRTYPRALAG